MRRVLIADDNFLIREGIKNVILTMPVELCGEVSDIDILPDKIKELNPDILLFEIMLCKQDAKNMLRKIKVSFPELKILIISDCVCDLPMLQFVRSGIDGFIRKNISREELFKSIRIVSDGGSIYSDDIKNLMANARQLQIPDIKNYSPREIEVLQLICKGRNNEQIADILSISENTVATHKRNIMQKAEVKKTSDLILWAFENGLVEK